MTDFPQQWLQRSGTPEEFEHAHLQGVAAALRLPVEKLAERFAARPFGNLTDSWRSLVRQLREDDELWFFQSPSHAFPKKLGCQGYAIIREGTVVETLITLET